MGLFGPSKRELLTRIEKLEAVVEQQADWIVTCEEAIDVLAEGVGLAFSWGNATEGPHIRRGEGLGLPE